MKERRPIANMMLTRTKEEISFTLAILMFRGCLWDTDKIYHPIGDGRFNYFLENVSAPVELPD
ncbi:hypothetical protein QUA27_25415 [Microcoleus sp. Pol14C6]|uniref:hypothetical protein n=1 Tax=unclassified Microcoleus TaxID=2642155 RepID=UPI002FD73167